MAKRCSRKAVPLRFFRRPIALASGKPSETVQITGTESELSCLRRHLLSSKSAKRKRHMAKSAEVHKTDTARIKMNMPFA